jgi:hypothetical protein
MRQACAPGRQQWWYQQPTIICGVTNYPSVTSVVRREAAAGGALSLEPAELTQDTDGTAHAPCPIRPCVKKHVDRRSYSRKEDEDLAERISGGVRDERAMPPARTRQRPARPALGEPQESLCLRVSTAGRDDDPVNQRRSPSVTFRRSAVAVR